MTKLLIATDNFLPRWDGIARFLSEIIPRLVGHYEITVIAPEFGAYEDPTIKLIKIPLSKLTIGDFRVPKTRKSIIKNAVKNSDIVFSQTIGPIGMNAIKAAKKYKKPIAAFIHSIEWELVPRAVKNPILKKYAQIFTKKIATKLYSKCDLLIMPSNHVSEIFLWNNVKTKSQIVNLGVDTQKFIPAGEELKNTLKSQLGFEIDDIIIGYHGRISREKDLVTLMRAFSRVQPNHRHLKLLIVGDGVEEIKKQLLRKNIMLVGTKNNPIPYLQMMDIYCLTSLTETTCLGMLEAMSCGLAVISTEVGFIKNYIKSGYNGLFFEKQNPYHLAKNLQTLILDEKLRKELAKNARKTVVERFSWEKTADGIIKALEGLERKK